MSLIWLTARRARPEYGREIRVRKMFGEIRSDIVSLHSVKADLVGRLAAMRLDFPVLT
jgi:hypothetical protein